MSAAAIVGTDSALFRADSSYRRAVITGPRQLEFDNISIPEPGPRQVLVRVAAAALCTWEQRVYSGIDGSSYPLVGGHEFSGEVVAFGPAWPSNSRLAIR